LSAVGAIDRFPLPSIPQLKDINHANYHNSGGCLAKADQEADPADFQKIQMLLNTWLKQTMKRRSLDEIIAEMQTKASHQGLTQDIAFFTQISYRFGQV
jgi:hypothetical protein